MKLMPLTCALLLLSLSANGQNAQIQHVSNSDFNCEALAPALSPFVQHKMFQGTILLAQNGKVLCQKNVGFADSLFEEKITESTRFPIASLSKPVMATLVLKLKDQGLIDTNKSLKHYLPQLSAPWAGEVTIAHLLTNRSGIPSHFMLPDWKKGKYRKTIPHDELIQDIAGTELNFTPGTQSLYTNLGWVLLGEVVEKVTGKKVTTVFNEVIFSPLAMDHTGLVYQTKEPLVTGFRWDKNGSWRPQENIHMQIFHAGSGIFTTAHDYLKFMAALHQSDFLSKQSREQMFSETPYAWQVETLALDDKVSMEVHSGNGQLLGHSSFVYQAVEDNVSVVLLNNTGMGYGHKQLLADDILRAFYRVSLPQRERLPSLSLNQSIIDNTWKETLLKLQQNPLTDLDTASLVVDLAQQLNWSRNTAKAIDLYHWLHVSFPAYQGIKRQFEQLCMESTEHKACATKSGS